MDARKKIEEAVNAFNYQMATAGDQFNRYAHAQQFLLACVEASDRYVRDGGEIPTLTLEHDQIAASGQPGPFESIPSVESGNDLPRYLRESGPIEAADRENVTPLTPVKGATSDWPWADEIERKLSGNKR